MANINGTNLAAPIVPFTTDDTYPTHYAKYGKGGHRTVATITERDGIFTALREEGMEVYVLETGKKYSLVGGLLNSNWIGSSLIIPGANTQILFNSKGSIGANANLTYSSITGTFNGGNSIFTLSSSYFLHKAGNNSLTGVFNTGISSGCLSSLTTGTENTGIGVNTLNLLSTGVGNLALGTNALSTVEGNFNFGLGYKSGELLPSGDFNLFLGSYSGYKESSEISNKLIIESNDSRNFNKDYLIEGDFSKRWVRFNGALRKRVVNITSVSSINNGTATSATANSITDTSKTFTADEFQNKFLVITGGVGVGQAMLITSNTDTTITTTKNFTVTPDNTSTYKIINGTTILGEKLNSEYYFDLTTEDHVVNLPSISSNYEGSDINFIINTNPDSKKLYILTNSTDVIYPDNKQQKDLITPLQQHVFKHNTTSWVYEESKLDILQPIKTSTKDLVIDLYSKIYKIDVAEATTVTFNIDSSYTPILKGNSLTIELDVNMTAVSAVTWPVNVKWIGGSAPTFGSIAKYRLVFRTEDAGTTWLGNLAYTY